MQVGVEKMRVGEEMEYNNEIFFERFTIPSETGKEILCYFAR